MARPACQWRHGEGLTLDEQGHIGMRTRLFLVAFRQNWGRFPAAVSSAMRNTRSPKERGFEHADIYQMLAYFTAADLPSGTLVYAADEGEPGIHKVRHTDRAIDVETLNLEGSPEAILKEVDRLANPDPKPDLSVIGSTYPLTNGF